MLFRSVFDLHAKPGRGRVEFLLNLDDKDIEMEETRTFNITGAFRQAVKSISGVVDIQDL